MTRLQYICQNTMQRNFIYIIREAPPEPLNPDGYTHWQLLELHAEGKEDSIPSAFEEIAAKEMSLTRVATPPPTGPVAPNQDPALAHAITLLQHVLEEHSNYSEGSLTPKLDANIRAFLNNDITKDPPLPPPLTTEQRDQLHRIVYAAWDTLYGTFSEPLPEHPRISPLRSKDYFKLLTDLAGDE